jgi:hypothetical protein
MPEEIYITRRKRKLKGKRLETFLKFWDIFGSTCKYKLGKAGAADAWLDIPTLTDKIVSDIYLGAKAEAMRRQRLIDAGRTPIWAQGWITGRRWEDFTEQDVSGPQKPVRKSNGYDNMVRALNILTNCGEGRFNEFCEGVTMPANDKEAVLNKYNLSHNVNDLTRGMLRDV